MKITNDNFFSNISIIILIEISEMQSTSTKVRFTT